VAYEALAGLMFHHGEQFTCACGNDEFRVEIDTDPLRFWCRCGAYYYEDLVGQLHQEKQEVLDGLHRSAG
jgi:hypothetical protein